MSKVIVASPVSYKLDRAGAIHYTGVEWLESIMGQDYPDLETYILADSLQPHMLKGLHALSDDRITIEEIQRDMSPDQRGKRRTNDPTYKRFADVRNMVLDHVLSTDADYMVSIDSDIITHPDAVSQLIQQMEGRQEYCIIAGIVNNQRRTGSKVGYPRAVYNFGFVNPKPKNKEKGPVYMRKERFRPGDFLNVGYTGACMAIRLSMLRENPAIRWGARIHGEDLYLCERVREAGHKIGVDTSIITLHMMDDVVWKEDLESFNNRELV